MKEPDPRSSGVQRGLELAGLLGFLACLGWFLVHSSSPVFGSEPRAAYRFGLDFGAHFPAAHQGYGLPLLVAVAAAAAGAVSAWLVNLPVLIGVAALLYLGVRLGVRTRDPLAAALGAAAALGLLVALDARLLLLLTNPYREGPAAAGLLGAVLLVIAACRTPARAGLLAGLAGLALGAATAVRESSLLLLGPLALYAALARRRRPELPVLRAALAFAVGLALPCAPLLAQDSLGSAPGFAAGALREDLADLGAALADRRGSALLGPVALGLVLGARRRELAVWALAAPALVVYALLSVGQVRRLGFNADLFALFLAGAGLALAADALLARWRPPRVLGLVALAALFAGAGGLALAQARTPAGPRLADLERFVRDFEATLPPQATLVGTSPLADLLRTFGSHAVIPARDARDLERRVRELFAGEGRVLVARSEEEERSVSRRFDLRDPQRFDPADYGLGGRFGADPIVATRVVPWSRKQTRVAVPVPEPGEYRLDVDLGSLSEQPRGLTLVLWDDEPVGRQPLDGLNAFAVSVSEAPRIAMVRLASDAPVPARIDAELVPLRRPLVLEFGAEELARHRGRFSMSFLEVPGVGTAIAREGSVAVPTPRPAGAAFRVETRIGLLPREAPYEARVAAESDGESLGLWTLKAEGGAAEPEWQDVSFVLHAPATRDPNTRVRWRLPDVPAASPPTLAIRRLQVQRLPVRTSLRVEPAAPRDWVYLDGGFGAAEARRGRWIRGDAALRLLVAETDEPGLITVRYVPAIRLTARRTRPRFRFDGEPRKARFHSDARRVTAEILLPPGALRGVSHRLEIQVPTDESGSGILLESVRIHPFRRPLPSG